MSNFDEKIIERLKRLEREVDRLRVKERPAGGSLKSVAIKNDGAIAFVPRNIAGFLFVWLSAHYAIISFDASPMPLCVKVAASPLIDVATVQLKGLQGTDGRITIAAFGGKLYIENRTGTTVTGGYWTL